MGKRPKRRRKAGANLARRILAAHIRGDLPEAGGVVEVRVDQAYTHDGQAPLVLLFLEALGIDRVRPLSAVYCDHRLDSPEVHRFLRSAAGRFGLRFAPPGAGISHVVHLEKFAAPWALVVGTDSRTPTVGAVGALGLACRRLEVAGAMARGLVRVAVPRVVAVHLKGRLAPTCTAKDLALHLIARLSARGASGRVLEYVGAGVGSLSVADRAVLANMGSEAGAVASIFPADAQTRRFLQTVGRARSWRRAEAEKNAAYDDEIEVNLRKVEPSVAQPPSPEHVTPARRWENERVEQVIVGSSSGAYFEDIDLFARALRRRRVHPDVDVAVVPGSRAILEALAREGVLADLAASGVRILEPGCGPDLGGPPRPAGGAASLRTFQRNLEGRAGATPPARVYLAGPLVAAATALRGVISDPRRIGAPPRPAAPRRFRPSTDAGPPPRGGGRLLTDRGPFAKIALPEPPPDRLGGPVLLKCGAHVTTGEIAGGFAASDPSFADRARAAAAEEVPGLVVAAENFGQGSAREDAVLALVAHGVRAVLARSFARPTRENMVRLGVLPLVLDDPADYEILQAGDTIEAVRVRAAIQAGEDLKFVRTDGKVVRVRLDARPDEIESILAGGWIRLWRRKKT